MQPTHWPTVVVVVDAAVAVPERPTKEPTEEPRAGLVEDAEAYCRLDLSLSRQLYG